MFSMGEYFLLPDLKREAYGRLVPMFFLTMNQVWAGMGNDDDDDDDDDDDGNKVILNDGGHGRVQTDRADLIIHVMGNEFFWISKPLIILVVHVLLNLREAEERPPAKLDAAYSEMKDQLTFTRLEAWAGAAENAMASSYIHVVVSMDGTVSNHRALRVQKSSIAPYAGHLQTRLASAVHPRKKLFLAV
ncbi:hypothetical protein LTR51_008830, partial [Lithohypha guttulata]